MRNPWMQVEYLPYLRYRAACAGGNDAQKAIAFAAITHPGTWRTLPVDTLPGLLLTAETWGHPTPHPFDVHQGLTWALPLNTCKVWQWRDALTLWGRYRTETLMHIPPVLAVFAEGDCDLNEAIRRVCTLPAPCGLWLEQVFDLFPRLAAQFPTLFDSDSGEPNGPPAVARFAVAHPPAEQLTWFVADDDVQRLNEYVLKMDVADFLAAASLKVDKLRMQNALTQQAARGLS